MATVDTEFEEDSFEDDFEPEEEMEQYKYDHLHLVYYPDQQWQ